MNTKILFAAVSLIAAAVPAAAQLTYHPLATSALTQDWSNTGLITTSDDWSGVASIRGYRGDDTASTATAIDPQTILVDRSTPLDVNANNANPDTFTTGGVTEFDALANPVVALQGSGTADSPNLVFYLNTTGVANVSISYTLRDVDGASDDAVQQVALQYRIGTSGDFINVPAGFVNDASTGPSLATLTTPVSVVLPAAVNNQAQVEVRVITANALGSDEWIGVDNIVITAAVPEPEEYAALAGAGLIAFAAYRRWRRA